MQQHQRRRLCAVALHLLYILYGCLAWSPFVSRRNLLARTTTASLVLTSNVATQHPQGALAADELPSSLRPFTKLAPLGSAQVSSKPKTTNLSLTQLASILSNALVNGATNHQGGYFVTGDIPTEIFRDDCVFTDPTNQVSSLSQYKNALKILFDASQSSVELVQPLTVNEAERTISGTIRSRGVLQLPWKPVVKAYESSIVYTVDKDGLIARQDQTWTKSASEALRESFTPSLFPAAPKSTLPKPTDEPIEVTLLYDKLNGRRPSDYTQQERIEIADLIATIVQRRYEWKRDLLPGKWILAYLQPGPDGGGVDRRIPFPEFPFNDSYQVFGRDSVWNIGQVFGPSLRVEVGGDLREVDTSSLSVPKRFVANIRQGKLCAFESTCVDLPITGEGIFDGVYLGSRLRIGQNINGGGARVVQLRLE